MKTMAGRKGLNALIDDSFFYETMSIEVFRLSIIGLTSEHYYVNISR